MLLMQYLQIIAAIFVVGEITIRLTTDIYKTREIQKNREELIKLNWTIPNIANEIENKFFLIFNLIHDPQMKYSIKTILSIITALLSAIILTGFFLKKYYS